MLNLDYERRDDYELNGVRILPIRWADSVLKVPYRDCMRSKYMLYDMDFKTWRRDAKWHSDITRQALLFMELGIAGRYNLINSYFGSNSQFQADIKVNNGLPNVEMRSIPGFSLFDWEMVIKQAETIHTVSSSIIYMLEVMDLAASEVHLYVRKPLESDFTTIDYLLEKHKYIFHL